MKRLFMSACVIAALLAAPAFAMLNVGAKAPDFKARASLGGKQFDFSLAEALKKGPVVLYFYPAAFTPGCTLEANNFAEAMDDYVPHFAVNHRFETNAFVGCADDSRRGITRSGDPTIAL